jgi:ferredoxin
VEGKAKLISDIYCDGLGDCLAECPQDAITIEEREAKAYDEQAVKARLAQAHKGGGCPASALRSFNPKPVCASDSQSSAQPASQLGHWPVQLKLVPPEAPFLKGADLLICADCVPFAVPDFHTRYLSGKAVLVGCPKLDDLQYYYEKLKAIYAEALPKSLTVLKMVVPCCGGIAQAAIQARNEVIPDTEVKVHTLDLQGQEIHVEN